VVLLLVLHYWLAIGVVGALLEGWLLTVVAVAGTGALAGALTLITAIGAGAVFSISCYYWYWCCYCFYYWLAIGLSFLPAVSSSASIPLASCTRARGEWRCGLSTCPHTGQSEEPQSLLWEDSTLSPLLAPPSPLKPGGGRATVICA
jgi:hypothetical protein